MINLKSNRIYQPWTLSAMLLKLLMPFVFFISIPAEAQYMTERPEWAGVWFNLPDDVPDFSGFEDILSGKAGRLKWSDLEPVKGQYDFSDLITILQGAKENDYYYYFEFWTGPNAPSWVFNDVPRVQTDRDLYFPYYLDEDYRGYVTALLDTIAGAMASWPANLVERILFIQPGFGSTGDRQLYKGTPIDPQYEISTAEYVSFMQEMTIAITESYWSRPQTVNMKFLWNISDYEGDPNQAGIDEEDIYGAWMKEHYNCQFRKQQFTIAIGYLCPNEMDQDNEQRDNFYGNSGRWGGNPEYVRGEFNEGTWGQTPLYNLNPFLYYYWTAISSVDRGLDGWELKVMDQKYKEAYEFSYRYSFNKKPEKSPYAFIALRDILDYSDISRFPVSQYGNAEKNNTIRINTILNKFTDYGAKNDDTPAALNEAGSGYLSTATGYNDCLWNVISRNNQRFISQIDANNTSAGYWRVGITQDQPYGRFTRGFDMANGKDTMYFDVNDLYFGETRNKGGGALKIKVIYYANDGGSWKLLYNAIGDSMRTAMEVDNIIGQNWTSKEVIVPDALLNNGGDRRADLMLVNTGGTDCRFHLIELDMLDTVIVKVNGVSINSCPAGEIRTGNSHQFSAAVSPPDAYNKAIIWTSLNTLVANVDQTGMVTTLSEGVVDIVVRSNDGDFTDTCSIIVSDTPSDQYPYENKLRTIPGRIEAEEYDEGGEGIAYHDDDIKEGVAAFRPDDNVDIYLNRPEGNGIAVAKTDDGEWLEYTLEVSPGYYDINFYYFTRTDNDYVINLYFEDAPEPFASFKNLPNPNNIDIYNKFTLKNVPVNLSGNIVLRMEMHTSVGVILIDALEFVNNPVTGVAISNCIAELEIADSYQMNALISPLDAVNSNLSWSSSDETIATVDPNGLVTAVSVGTADIIVITEDGHFQNNCSISVIGPKVVSVSGVTISNCISELNIDDTLQLIAEVDPVNATDQSVNWSSSNTSVATVGVDGIVTAVSAGETTLTVATNDGGFSDICTISVDTEVNVSYNNTRPQIIEVYPNPASNFLNFRFSKTGSENKISLYSMLGQLLYSETTYCSNPEIYIGDFSSEGMFIVKVISDETIASFKVFNETLKK